MSDQAWAGICAAAGCTPGAEARAELSAVLFDEYPVFRYDPVGVQAAKIRAERMLKHLDAFAADHAVQFLPASPEAIQGSRDAAKAYEIKTERDRFYIDRLRR